MEKPKSAEDEDWGAVVAAGENVVDAYNDLLSACKQLGEELGVGEIRPFPDDYVLGKVMPKTAGERDKTKRIMEWLWSERSDWARAVAVREEKRRRSALLSRLNLTSEEKELLGI